MAGVLDVVVLYQVQACLVVHDVDGAVMLELKFTHPITETLIPEVSNHVLLEIKRAVGGLLFSFNLQLEDILHFSVISAKIVELPGIAKLR